MYSVLDRFLKYVKIHTTSDDECKTFPSTARQFELAKFLVKELEELGLEDVSLDENCYVMATLPANTEEEIPTIGFIAHMDTSPEVSGENVNPQIIKYEGGDIPLSPYIVMREADFPELKNYIGQEIITTDGTTLLGADDKAGIAEIIAAMEYLKNHPEIKHGKIKIGFTPDEEVGQGADRFDIKKFDAKFAYTVDGGGVGELEYENFNGASANYTIIGRSVHPGSAKNKMINASLVATELIDLFPIAQTPQHTEGYEGFFHIVKLQGTVEEAKVGFIIRDHDKMLFEKKKQLCIKNAEILQEKYGKDRILVEVKDSYYNMREVMEKNMYVVEYAKKAMENIGIKPDIKPIRGGTDGARLSFNGLPCPNFFTGGHNYHGRFEYIPIPSMEKAVEVIIEICKIVAAEK